MRLGRVRPDDEEEARVLDLGDRIAARSSAQRPDQAVKSRSVSGGLAGVDGVRPDSRSRQLLDEVVLLVREPRGREEADGLRAVTLHHASEPGRGSLDRVLPRRRVELAVLAADERLREAVGVVDEVEREASLDAQVALVREVFVLRSDLDDVPRLGIEVEVDLAADSTEGAVRPHLLERALGASGALLELLVDRAGRAHGEAAAAELALGVEPGEAPGGDDPRVPTAPLEGERRALHDLLRVA